MADPSREEPSSPQKGTGSGSSSEGRSREHTVIPGSGNQGGSVLSSTPTPPVAQPPASHPPTAQAGLWGERPMKKKAKMVKEAAVGMKVVMVEEPGKKKKFASLDNLPGRARTCSICRREFPTARALFGHMRSHPERIWRGAHPPPVSPKREEERQDAEQTLQAQELTRNLLNIGQTILRTSKFKEKEGFQAGVSSSSGAILTAHGADVEIGTTKEEEKGAKATEVVSVSLNGSSSGDSWNRKMKKKTRKKKKKTGKGPDFTDEDQRKRIHSQIDLNKEAPDEDDEEEEETPGASSN